VKHRISIGVIVLALAVPASAELLNRVVATVDGEPITAHQLDDYVRKQAIDFAAPGAPTREQVLRALILETLVEKEIETRGIAVGDRDIDHYIDRILEQNQLPREQLAAALEQQGLTLEAYRKQVKGEIEKIQLLNREIRGKVNVTPQDVERYYEAHKKDYEVPAQIHLRHIVLRLSPDAPEAVVEAARERLLATRERIVDDDEDFAEVAKEVSEDPSGAHGGDLGEFTPGQVLDEFEAALETMEDGDVSEPIRTANGLHLVKLEKRTAAGYKPVAEVSAAIKEKLFAEALDARYKKWLEEDLEKRHFVEVKL
jgi:peptidyl-prolyl cis-trans isomerase SurA